MKMYMYTQFFISLSCILSEILTKNSFAIMAVANLHSGYKQHLIDNKLIVWFFVIIAFIVIIDC